MRIAIVYDCLFPYTVGGAERWYRALADHLQAGHQDTSPAGAGRPDPTAERPPVVVFAGRQIPEKRVALVPDAIASARAALPTIRGIIFGDGPERQAGEIR